MVYEPKPKKVNLAIREHLANGGIQLGGKEPHLHGPIDLYVRDEFPRSTLSKRRLA